MAWSGASAPPLSDRSDAAWAAAGDMWAGNSGEPKGRSTALAFGGAAGDATMPTCLPSVSCSTAVGSSRQHRWWYFLRHTTHLRQVSVRPMASSQWQHGVVDSFSRGWGCSTCMHSPASTRLAAATAFTVVGAAAWGLDTGGVHGAATMECCD